MAQLQLKEPDHRRRSPQMATLLAGVVFISGTGGFHTLLLTNEVGYTLPGIQVTTAKPRRTARDKIQRIRSGMGISNAGLARVLGVSRQALYNWLGGDIPSPAHEAMLDELSDAFDVLATLGRPLRTILTQPIESGRTFWELVQAGKQPLALAERVRVTYERRGSQRMLMSQRLAAKRAKGVVADIFLDDHV